MSWYSLFQMLLAYACHKKFGASFRWLHQRVFKVYFKNYPKEKLLFLMESFLDHHFESLIHPLVFTEFLEAKGNSVLALLSSSPDFIVEPIAKRLEIPFWIGTCYPVDSYGRLCKITHIVDGEYKANFLKQIMKRFSILPNHVTAYTDSFLDLPMMEVAGTKIGVNPDKHFYNHCIKNGWRVIL